MNDDELIKQRVLQRYAYLAGLGVVDQRERFRDELRLERSPHDVNELGIFIPQWAQRRYIELGGPSTLRWPTLEAAIIEVLEAELRTRWLPGDRP